MTHPLVSQLHYAKERWLDGHAGLTEEDAAKQFGNGNSIGWMVGHLACFDQMMWCETAQSIKVTDATDACGFRMPATTPPLNDMLDAWHAIQAVVNPFLNTLTEADMSKRFEFRGRPGEQYGTVLHRMTWHYWYHLGEMQAIRQALGHTDLDQFVGRMTDEGRYVAPAPSATDLLAQDGYDVEKVLSFVRAQSPDFFANP